MFSIEGRDFSNLINREFVSRFAIKECSRNLPHRFDCRSQNIRNEHFDILTLSSDFEDDIQVKNLEDTTHVSLHFQIQGSSTANISGLPAGMTMGTSQNNLIHCVQPTSTFIFPKQKNYRYVCVGLKQDFFREVLAECGSDFELFINKSRTQETFSLYQSNQPTSADQLLAINAIQNPPIADSLRVAYIRSKVKELLFLTVSGYHQEKTKEHFPFNSRDRDKLYAVQEYITQHFLLPHSLESLSKTFLLNEFKLKKGFKVLFGTTVFKYIQTLRLNFAFTLLKDSAYSQSEVAVTIGYESETAFIRAFKEFAGITPGVVIKNSGGRKSKN